MISAFTGLVAGVVHAVSGPDHVAAVAPMAFNRTRSSAVTGLQWGSGHAGGVLFIGAVALALRGALPLDLVSSWAEKLVGLVLIGIGLWGFRRSISRQLHCHEHAHGGMAHAHFHVHGDRGPSAGEHTHSHAAFYVGALHGLAGSSHFWGVLPALAFPSTLQAGLYLIAYCAGTILAMALLSIAIGRLAGSLAASGQLVAYRLVMLSCSLLAAGIGVAWLVRSV